MRRSPSFQAATSPAGLPPTTTALYRRPVAGRIGRSVQSREVTLVWGSARREDAVCALARHPLGHLRNACQSLSEVGLLLS
jgi:hypothetical protein